MNEKDVKPEHAPSLLDPCKEYIDLIRIAVNPSEFDRALKLGETIKKLGFHVSFNVMYMAQWEHHQKLYQLMPEVDGIVDFLYMVDSYDGIYPQDVKKTIDAIRNKTNIKLGFHGHNNLELALANSLTALENGVDIVDSTITGMGRGAGNLKTELFLSVLNSKGYLDFDYNHLSKITNFRRYLCTCFLFIKIK